MNLVQINIFRSICDPTIFSNRCRCWNRVLSDEIVNNKLFMLYSSLSRSRYQFSYKKIHGRSYHCLAVGAIWNLSKFTGSTGKFFNSNFLESRSVLGAKFSGAYNTSTGASKYIQIVKNYYPANFQNLPKLCITFKYKYFSALNNFQFAGACLGLGFGDVQ